MKDLRPAVGFALAALASLREYTNIIDQNSDYDFSTRLTEIAEDLRAIARGDQPEEKPVGTISIGGESIPLVPGLTLRYRGMFLSYRAPMEWELTFPDTPDIVESTEATIECAMATADVLVNDQGSTDADNYTLKL